MSPWFRRKSPSEERPQLVNPEPDSERRRAYRQVGEFRAELIPQVGRPVDITVLNLSPTGLAFAGPQKVQVDQDVCIRFTTPPDRPVVYTASVHAHSQWATSSARKGEPWSCGVIFQPMTLTQHLNLIRFFLEHFGLRFAGPGDKRRQVRLGFNKAVQVVVRVDTTRKMLEGEVKNISVDGIGFVCAERLEPSTRLTVSLRAGSRESIPLKGIVVHARKLSDGHFQIGVLTNLTSDADRAMLTEILVSAGRKIFEERDSEPFREERVTGRRPPGDSSAESDDILRPSTGEPDKKTSQPLHRVIEGWRPPWEREGGHPDPYAPPEARAGTEASKLPRVREPARKQDEIPFLTRRSVEPPAAPVEPDTLDATADDDDDEPFSWGGTPARLPESGPAAAPDEEDPLEAWARSVNLAPPAEPPEGVASSRPSPLKAREWSRSETTSPREPTGAATPLKARESSRSEVTSPREPTGAATPLKARESSRSEATSPWEPTGAATPLKARESSRSEATSPWEPTGAGSLKARESSRSEGHGVPGRPAPPEAGGPAPRATEWPTLQRLGPLVPPSRADAAPARPRNRTPEPAPPSWEEDEAPPTVLRLGPLVPPSQDDEPGEHPRERRHEPARSSWTSGETPPTVHLGPLVPSPGSEGRSSRPRSPRQPAPDSRPPGPAASRSWAARPPQAEPAPTEDESPPTVQLGPLVPPSSSADGAAAPGRPSRQPAAPVEGSDVPVRPWTPTRTSATPTGRTGKVAPSATDGQDERSSPLPWRRDQEAPAPAPGGAAGPRGSAFRSWNLTSRTSGPSQDDAGQSTPDPEGRNPFHVRKPVKGAAESPRQGQDPAPPASTFRPWRRPAPGPEDS